MNYIVTIRDRTFLLLIITFFLTEACNVNPEVEQKQFKEIDNFKLENSEIASCYISNIDTAFFLEKNQCYFRSINKDKKLKNQYEPKIEGDLYFFYFIYHDTLKLMTLISISEDNNGSLKTDTSMCFYKIYNDSLVPIHVDTLTYRNGNSVYSRQSGVYKRIR